MINNEGTFKYSEHNIFLKLSLVINSGWYNTTSSNFYFMLQNKK